MRLRTISDADLKVLREALWTIKRLRVPGDNTVSPDDDFQTPDVHIAVAESGIPARSSSTPGQAACTVFRILEGLTASSDYIDAVDIHSKTVYNYSPTAVPAGEFVPVIRDKFGSWIVLSPYRNQPVNPPGFAGFTGCKSVYDQCTRQTEYWRFTNGLVDSITLEPCPVCSLGTGTGTIGNPCLCATVPCFQVNMNITSTDSCLNGIAERFSGVLQLFGPHNVLGFSICTWITNPVRLWMLCPPGYFVDFYQWFFWRDYTGKWALEIAYNEGAGTARVRWSVSSPSWNCETPLTLTLETPVTASYPFDWPSTVQVELCGFSTGTGTGTNYPVDCLCGPLPTRAYVHVDDVSGCACMTAQCAVMNGDGTYLQGTVWNPCNSTWDTYRVVCTEFGAYELFINGTHAGYHSTATTCDPFSLDFPLGPSHVVGGLGCDSGASAQISVVVNSTICSSSSGTGTGTGTGGSGGSQTFTASGTFTATVTGPHLFVGWGEGGQGGNGDLVSSGGAGGGGGGYGEKTLNLTAGDNVSITIGTGGTGVNTEVTEGMTIRLQVQCGTSAVGPTAGAGGGLGAGDFGRNGGNGGPNSGGTPGGGGGSAGDTTNGSIGGTPTGGAAGTTNGATGGDGNAGGDGLSGGIPGAGGGGGGISGAGGNGARGEVRVTW